MRNVFLISFAFFFVFAGFGAAQQYLTVVLGAENREWLALTSLFTLYAVFLAASLLVSKLVHAIGGLKRSLSVGAASYALFCASVATGSALVLLLASAAIGVGAALMWSSAIQIIADSSEEGTVGRNLAYHASSGYVGIIAGTFAGGYLFEHLSVAATYLIFAALAAIAFAFNSGVEPPREEASQGRFHPQFVFDRRMLALFPFLFGAFFLSGQTFTEMNSIIAASVGIGAIPFVIAAFRGSNIVSSLGTGSLTTRFGKTSLSVVTVVIGMIGAAFLLLAPSLSSLLIGAALIGLYQAASYPIVLAWLKETFATDEYLDTIGIFHVYNITGILAAITANLYLPGLASFTPGVIALLLAIPGILLFSRFTRIKSGGNFGSGAVARL